jgi:hypothetical protein
MGLLVMCSTEIFLAAHEESLDFYKGPVYVKLWLSDVCYNLCGEIIVSLMLNTGRVCCSSMTCKRGKKVDVFVCRNGLPVAIDQNISLFFRKNLLKP